MSNIGERITACAIARQFAAEAGEPCDNARAVDMIVKYPCLKYLCKTWDGTLGETTIWYGRDRNGMEQPATEHAYIHISGKLEGPIGKLSHRFMVACSQHTMGIALDEKSKLQKREFSENEEVHIFAQETDAEPVARYIVTGDTVQLLYYCCGASFDEKTLQSFLKLSKSRQAAYTALAVDRELRRSVLYAVSYYVCQALVRKQLVQDDVYKILEAFNGTVRLRIGCKPVKPAFFAVYTKDLFGDKVIHWGAERPFFQHNVSGLLMLFGVVYGISGWHRGGYSIARIIMEEVLPRKLIPSAALVTAEFLVTMIPAELLNEIVLDMVKEYAELSGDTYETDMCLYTVLCKSSKLRPETVRLLSESLFRRTFYQEQIRKVRMLLEGPNGKQVEEYVLDGYYSGCEQGVAQYHFCAAVITNNNRRKQGIDPVAAAVEAMRNATKSSEYLLNVACLGMLLWNKELPKSKKSAVALKLDEIVARIEKRLDELR